MPQKMQFLIFKPIFSLWDPEKMTHRWKTVKKWLFGSFFDPILYLHYTNIDIWSEFWTPCMPLNTSFLIFDQFLACETRKNDSKFKNGEKWLFQVIYSGVGWLWIQFFLVSHAKNWSNNTNNTFRGMPGIQNSLQMSI